MSIRRIILYIVITKNNFIIRRDRFTNIRKVIYKFSYSTRMGTENKNNKYFIRRKSEMVDQNFPIRGMVDKRSFKLDKYTSTMPPPREGVDIDL